MPCAGSTRALLRLLWHHPERGDAPKSPFLSLSQHDGAWRALENAQQSGGSGESSAATTAPGSLPPPLEGLRGCSREEMPGLSHPGLRARKSQHEPQSQAQIPRLEYSRGRESSRDARSLIHPAAPTGHGPGAVSLPDPEGWVWSQCHWTRVRRGALLRSVITTGQAPGHTGALCPLQAADSSTRGSPGQAPSMAGTGTPRREGLDPKAPPKHPRGAQHQALLWGSPGGAAAALAAGGCLGRAPSYVRAVLFTFRGGKKKK